MLMTWSSSVILSLILQGMIDVVDKFCCQWAAHGDQSQKMSEVVMVGKERHCMSEVRTRSKSIGW